MLAVLAASSTPIQVLGSQGRQPRPRQQAMVTVAEYSSSPTSTARPNPLIAPAGVISRSWWGAGCWAVSSHQPVRPTHSASSAGFAARHRRWARTANAGSTRVCSREMRAAAPGALPVPMPASSPGTRPRMTATPAATPNTHGS